MLANLFLHYAFDAWLTREHPGVPFERYADDAVIHCGSLARAETVLAALRERMSEAGLELHPDKTRIVYCKDGRRRGDHTHTSFTFLGFDFRPRPVRLKSGKMMPGFNPAVSKHALKEMGAHVRSWRLHRCTNLTESDLARWINPIVRGSPGVDAVLRGVSPLSAVSPPGTHQRLLDAVAAQQVQTAAQEEESPEGMGEGGRLATAALRPLGMDSLRSRCLVIRTTRAV